MPILYFWFNKSNNLNTAQYKLIALKFNFLDLLLRFEIFLRTQWSHIDYNFIKYIEQVERKDQFVWCDWEKMMFIVQTVIGVFQLINHLCPKHKWKNVIIFKIFILYLVHTFLWIDKSWNTLSVQYLKLMIEIFSITLYILEKSNFHFIWMECNAIFQLLVGINFILTLESYSVNKLIWFICKLEKN